MNYLKYYEECALDCLYLNFSKFTYSYLFQIFNPEEIREELFKNADFLDQEDWIIKFPYKKEFTPFLSEFYTTLLGHLEGIYNCHLMIEKVFIYRTMPCLERTTSTIWHYDNTPPTQLKSIFYLTNVFREEHGPIEFCPSLIKESTRQGTENWELAPNNSRLANSEIENKETVKLYGVAGTGHVFNPNCVHRANPPHSEYRDVINIITQPTKDKSDRLKYISGFEASSSPLKDPEKRRKILVV